MLLLALACVKYPDFSANRRAVPNQPVPGFVELQGLESEELATELPTPIEVRVPQLPEQASAVPAALELQGSRWTLSYTSPDGDQSYDLEFGPRGVLHLHNPHDSTPDNDAWVQSGALVELSFNDGFVRYRGLYQDRGLIRGMADNGQDSWPFVLLRRGRAMDWPGALGEDAGRDELVGASFAITDMDPREPVDLRLTLQQEGVSIQPVGDEGNDWTLSEGVLYIWVNERNAQLTAVQTEAGSWFGTGLSKDGHEWAFTMRSTD